MKQTRIIWVASNAPYDGAPAAGGQTYNYYFKSFSRDERFEVRLVCWGNITKRDQIERENSHIAHHIIYSEPSILVKLKKISNIESSYNPWNKNANLISNYCAAEIKRYLVQCKQEGFIPNIIILEWTNTVVLAREILKIYPSVHLVASEHDVTYIGYRRKMEFFNSGLDGFLWKVKYKNERRRELEALSVCDRIYVHNSENSDALVRDGVDRELIRSLTPYYHNMSELMRRSNGKDILFFGAMSRPENYLSAEWFVAKVMPLLSDYDIRFVVLGGNPPESLINLQSERVVITGFVDDILPYFEKSMCLVAPLVLGAGIKVKILEAMSSGIPVLTNDIGIEGIPAKDGEEYFYCKDPEDYVEIIKRIYEESINEKSVSKKAKDFLVQNFSFLESVGKYKTDMIELAGHNE